MSFSPCPPDALGGNIIQEQRDRWEMKRCRAARELVLSEQRYCQQLELVTTYFVEILKAKGTLKEDITESIFSSIKAIHSVNQSLLVHLENGYFGRGFDQFCPQLHHYNVFVDNIYDAKKVLWIQLKKNKAFRRFKKLQEARPEFNNHKLEDLLQLPIERIDQYKRLLQEMTANTRPDNPEFQQLSRAVAAVEELHQRIQNNTRRHENHLQLRRVQKLLKGRKTKVLAAGRWYIREGWLKVVPTKGSDVKPKMFFLFSDILLQAKPCSSLHPTDSEKFAGEHAYPLQECTVEKVFGNTKGKGGLLSLTLPKAKLLLMSSNPEDFNDWYQSLSSAVRKLQPRSTVVLQPEDPNQEPLGSASGGQNLPSSNSNSNRKRNMVSNEPNEAGDLSHRPTGEWESSVPKRMKESTSDQSSEVSTSSCVIL
ncbi:rho guanine nucleotide exchange factor 39 [Corythoichthys intestinalis]|uniref:rho guanine nucleotide exchange factor 39 n=1 Tax=Corythoichthys intestinalis TaxID=161448 RepID=UPI0025A4D896|nr:rho guanine nucleotide exchange factor 39 [Corythoichthys intestinalis]XP_061809553.1 rho guanine nucleotide exchange factor 39-like [Nerophis lumbriciformis]